MNSAKVTELLRGLDSLRVHFRDVNPVCEIDIPMVRNRERALHERTRFLERVFNSFGSATYWSPDGSSFGRALVTEKVTVLPAQNDADFGLNYGRWCFFFPGLDPEHEALLAESQFDSGTLGRLLGTVHYELAIVSYEDDIEWKIWISTSAIT